MATGHLFATGMEDDETLGEKVEQVCELLHSVDPKVRVMISLHQASRAATRGLVEAGLNVFCYHARLEYDNAPEGIDVFASDRRELWFYNASDSEHGIGKESDPLGCYRYLHWTAFHHGATGVHFWNILWSHGRSPVWTEESVGQAYFPMDYCIGPGYPEPPDDVKTAKIVIPSRRWRHERRVIGKAEHLAKGANPRFVVASLSREESDSPTVYEKEYCVPGDMENRIKEQQLYLFADRTIASTMRAN